MAELLASLPAPAGTCHDTVLYLGAGGMDAPPHALTALRRLVLVDGDADTAATLRRDWVAQSQAAVIEAVVSARGDAQPWHRYSLPSLNGPIDQQALTRVYPRLRRIDSQTVASCAVRDLIEQHVPAYDEGAPREQALLIDLPGQEEALLGALDSVLLQRFDTVVVHGEHEPAALAQAGFALTHTDPEAGPLWPVRVYRFDRLRHALQQSRTALDVAHAQQRALAAQLQEARDAAAQLQHQVQAAQAATLEQADALAQAHAQALQATQAEQGQLRQDLDAMRRRAKQLQGQLDEARLALQQERSELDQAHAEVQALHQQLADSVPRPELTRVHEQHAELVRQHEQAERERASLQQQLHDEQTRQQRRVQQLQEELLKAEGQLDMIKSLLLAGQGL